MLPQGGQAAGILFVRMGIGMARRITEKEIEKLYIKYKTPPHVISHCRAVTRVALGIAGALNEHGYHLDLDLIRSAGLSHDIARTQEDHGGVCADILEQMGYHDEAAIVRVHMNYPLNPLESLNETDLVCLGDRLVKEDKYVGLDERFRYIMDKAPHSQEIQTHLTEHRERMRHLLQQIEELTGIQIDALFEDGN